MFKWLKEIIFGDEDTRLWALHHPSQDWSDHSQDDVCPICGKSGAEKTDSRSVSYGGETSWYDDYHCPHCSHDFEVNY